MVKPMTPEPILRMLNGLWITQTLAVAVDLDVFTLVSNDANTLEKIADSLHTSARPIEMLLNALVSLDLLEKQGSNYHNTQLSETFLVKGKSNYYGDFVLMETVDLLTI